MDTRSRNTEGLRKWLFEKKTRIWAFILACLFVGVSMTGFCYTRDMQMVSDMKEDYTESKEYHYYLSEMYGELYVFSAAYLNDKNRDDLQSELLYFMDYNKYKYRRTDEGIVPLSDRFIYYVSYDNGSSVRYTTNSDVALEFLEVGHEDELMEILPGEYDNYIIRRSNSISGDAVSNGETVTYSYPNASSGWHDYARYTTEHYSSSYLPIGGWFYDNYGRYFFNVGFDEPVILYAKLGDAEREAIARNGERTKFIVEVDHGEYTDREEYWDEIPELEEDDYWYYDERYYDLEELEDYESYIGNDEAITIFIAPNPDMLAKAANDYHRLTTNYVIAQVVTIACAVLFGVLLIYLIVISGRERALDGTVTVRNLHIIEKLPTELTAAFAVLGVVGVFLINDFYTDIIAAFAKINTFMGTAELCISLMFALPAAVSIGAFMELVLKTKCRTILKDLFLVKAAKWLYRKFRASRLYKAYNRKTMAEKFAARNRVILICVLAVPLSLFISYTYGEDDFFFATSFIAFPFCLFCIIRNIIFGRDFKKLSRQIEAIGKGEPFAETVSESSPIYHEHLSLNSISEAVSRAVEEQIKSEKMKIELVANVSHDLKTPLTSIISYIDLLKKLELSDEASGYVQILDRKSQKLKSIVQDVFSLAKATSGIEVELKRIDFVMLFNQCLADADDLLTDCGRTIKTTIKTASAPVLGDGNKLYRVFQNLIGNAVKYSLEGTRIFLDIYESGENIVFSTRNVSAVPLDMDVNELTERFVRGDSSRTDGGSGLGLSIAKTFTEACGGTFTLELDGDMFKARVAMPILTEETKEETEKIIPEDKDI